MSTAAPSTIPETLAEARRVAGEFAGIVGLGGSDELIAVVAYAASLRLHLRAQLRKAIDLAGACRDARARDLAAEALRVAGVEVWYDGGGEGGQATAEERVLFGAGLLHASDGAYGGMLLALRGGVKDRAGADGRGAGTDRSARAEGPLCRACCTRMQKPGIDGATGAKVLTCDCGALGVRL